MLRSTPGERVPGLRFGFSSSLLSLVTWSPQGRESPIPIPVIDRSFPLVPSRGLACRMKPTREPLCEAAKFIGHDEVRHMCRVPLRLLLKQENGSPRRLRAEVFAMLSRSGLAHRSPKLGQLNWTLSCWKVRFPVISSLYHEHGSNLDAPLLGYQPLV